MSFNWETVPFEELYLVPSRNGVSKPSRVRGSGNKMINMGELFANDRIFDIPMELVPLTDSEKINAKVESGDLLFARQSLIESGAGKCSIVCGVSNLTVFESYIIRVRLNKDIADSLFYYYYFKSGVSPIRSIVQHSVQAGIKASDLAKLPVILPKLSTQRRIASLLSALDDKIEVNNKINDNLQQQALAIYDSMFGKTNSVNATSGTLKDIAEITMGQSPSGSSYNENGTGEVFYQGRAEFGSRFPTRRLFTTEPKRMAEAGDILLSVRAPVGDLNVAYECCCIGRGLGAIHSKTGHQSFILYTMFALRPELDVFNGEGTVFGSINRDALNNMPIMIPSVEDLDAFESIVSPMDAMIRRNYEETCRLQDVRDSLLPRLMSGEIDVSAIQF